MSENEAARIVRKNRADQKVQVRMHRTEDAGRSGMSHSNVEGVEFLTHDGNTFFVYFDGLGGLAVRSQNLARNISVEPLDHQGVRIKARVS